MFVRVDDVFLCERDNVRLDRAMLARSRAHDAAVYKDVPSARRSIAIMMFPLVLPLLSAVERNDVPRYRLTIGV